MHAYALARFSLLMRLSTAVAVASAFSRALSYGTIYNIKLLRRAIETSIGPPRRGRCRT